MKTMLEHLRTLNPSLPLYSVQDAAFRDYGRVIGFPAENLIAACEKAAVLPESGSRYVPDLPELEALTEDFARVQRELRGEGPCQIGCCWGHSSRLNCLEYHRSSEHNIAVTDMVLLLARQQDMEGNDLPAGKVTAFYVPKGTTIEVYATTLHFCPCQVSDEGFICIVVLPRGTNHPLTQPQMHTGEGRLLWARDKWLIAHPENESVIARGAYPGLHGENYTIKYKE